MDAENQKTIHKPWLSYPYTLDEREKVCPRCQESWPLDAEFWFRSSRSRDGYYHRCRACDGEAKGRFVEAPKPKTISRVITDEQGQLWKVCISCQEQKPLSLTYWYSARSKRDGFSPACKTCVNARLKQKREEKKLAACG